ncbi:hypothetical protein TNCV_1996521 [Trichonephila clavipes]|uniref:Uncharacterized protein n=1 Tax=Trichonephila clavipes TaxID=2585209 RepID=A0A8X6RLX1_TRICX|nr:hypothetical protein TNCV_1996521 [Trichonephila clavipes]
MKHFVEGLASMGKLIPTLRIWASQNLYAVQKQPLHSEKSPISCDLTTTSMIVPYPCEAITANGIKISHANDIEIC